MYTLYEKSYFGKKKIIHADHTLLQSAYRLLTIRIRILMLTSSLNKLASRFD